MRSGPFKKFYTNPHKKSKKMGNVIGLHQTPVQRAESWCTMCMLRESVNYLKTRDPVAFESTIEKETNIYRNELSAFVRNQ